MRLLLIAPLLLRSHGLRARADGITIFENDLEEDAKPALFVDAEVAPSTVGHSPAEEHDDGGQLRSKQNKRKQKKSKKRNKKEGKGSKDMARDSGDGDLATDAPTDAPTDVPTHLPTKGSTFSPTSSSNDPTTTPSTIMATIAPTSIPLGSIYYKGFEQGTFPDFPQWTTTNEDNADLVWELTTQKANSGVYSIKSPNLESEGEKLAASSKANFALDTYLLAGELHFSVLASVMMPLDNFQIVVDGVNRYSQFELMTEFEENTIQLSPGAHTIDFVYTFNPLSIPADNLPSATTYRGRIGAVFIDDVYFVPFNDPTLSPSHSPVAAATLACPSTLDKLQEIDDRATIYYTVVPSEPAYAGNGILCARLEVIGEQWVAFGTSVDGFMIGSDAIIGDPNDGIVRKYSLNGKSLDSVVPMEESKQTLSGTSLIQEEGKTKMAFTKLLVEPGEIPILESGENIFLYAYGSSNLLGYHAIRGSLKLDFATPLGSIYYKGFEQGIFPDSPMWTTTNDDNPSLIWKVTAQKADNGMYSLRSPDLVSEEQTSGSSKATFITDDDWPAGQIHFSLLASIEMALDKFELFVDGDILKGVYHAMTEFEEITIPLRPGQHTIDFVYTFNPLSIPGKNLPSPNIYQDRIGIVYIDNVHFLPVSAPPPVPPPEEISYTGFENPQWPQSYPEWSTSNGDNPAMVWDITNEKSNSGMYSVRSPELDTTAKTRASSTLTLNTDPNGLAGMFHYSVFAGIQLPFDNFEVKVDGSTRGSVNSAMAAFEERVLPLGPGAHIIEFVYNFNPVNIPAQSMPPASNFPDRIGTVYIDDVYFVPSA